jgi:hypothetical protein
MRNINLARRIILSLSIPLLFLSVMLTGTYRTNISADGWSNTPLREHDWLWQVGVIIITILLWLIWSPNRGDGTPIGDAEQGGADEAATAEESNPE